MENSGCIMKEITFTTHMLCSNILKIFMVLAVLAEKGSCELFVFAAKV